MMSLLDDLQSFIRKRVITKSNVIVDGISLVRKYSSLMSDDERFGVA